MSQPDQATYLGSISVENLACFGPRQTLDLTLDDGRPARWTLILGDNGTGKTTLLQAIAGMTPVVMPPLVKDVKARAWILGWPPLRSMLRPYTGSELAISADFILGPHPDCEPTELERVAVRAGLEPTRDFAGVPWKIVKRLADAGCFGYGAARNAGRSQLIDGDPEGFDSATLFDDEATLISPDEWLAQMDYAAAKQKDLKGIDYIARRDQVKTLLVRLLPDVSDVEIRVKEGPSAEVIFETPYGRVPFQRMGLGYRTMTTWVVDLAARMFRRSPDAEDPLAQPAVVLVDEIDLHLHPSWQRRLMHWLSELFPNVQFIATAHSPLIVQAAQDARIAVLRREGDHVLIDQSFASVTGWRVDQLLTSELFGLPTARAAVYDSTIAERTELLSKSALSGQDKQRLAELDQELTALPAGESAADIEAMDIIRRAAEALKREGAD